MADGEGKGGDVRPKEAVDSQIPPISKRLGISLVYSKSIDIQLGVRCSRTILYKNVVYEQCAYISNL